MSSRKSVEADKRTFDSRASERAAFVLRAALRIQASYRRRARGEPRRARPVTAVMSGAALRQESLLLPKAFTETPAGPGLTLDSFLVLVHGLAGDELASRLPGLFTEENRH